MKKRRRGRDGVGLSHSSASGHHREGAGHQGKPEHAGLPGGAGGDENRDQGSPGKDFQGEGPVRAYRQLSGQGTPPGTVRGISSGLEKGICAVEGWREDARLRTEFVRQSLAGRRWSSAKASNQRPNRERLRLRAES